MLRQFLIDYSNDVINGEVVACQKHKWSCKRFLRDIEREGTDAFPFVFDEDKAMRFFEWMNLFKHTKGVLKGQHIVPHEIQYFVFGNIYGWVHRDTGYRRFRKAYWQVGRKNAKSQSLACVGTYEEAALGEGMSEVYIGATKKEQSDIVYKEAVAMINNCPDLKDKFRVAYGRITHVKTGSIMRALSKEDRKSGDGLNPQCGIIDEYHAHETDEIYNILDSGMIARPQPLFMTITTPGENLNSPCYRVEYEFVGRLLNPDDSTELNSYFAMVNEMDRDEDGELLDDINDENSWLKPNPIAASYPEGRANIRSRLAEAREKPEMMGDVLTKNMGIWINAGQKKYMRMDRWTSCTINENEMPDLSGAECFVGVDMSMKIDLSSVGFDFPLGDGRFFVYQHSFIPEETMVRKIKTDRIPYDLWARQGWLTVIPGAVVDQDFIEEYIERVKTEKGWIVKELDYDPHVATQFAQHMDKKGYPTVEIRQGVQTLSEPIKDFRELVYQKKILHLNDPLLFWAMSNAVTKMDQKENMLLDKEKSTNRIDPVAALINAHSRARLQHDKKRSIYEERGIVRL